MGLDWDGVVGGLGGWGLGAGFLMYEERRGGEGEEGEMGGEKDSQFGVVLYI